MTLRRWCLWWLAAALLAAPALGHMHRVVHGPQAHLGHVHGSAHGDGHGDAHDHGGWVASLFSAHDDDSSCRLFDQLGQGDALFAAATASFSLKPPSALLRRYEGAARLRWATLFDARGPPSFLR